MSFVDASKGEIAIAYDGESASVEDGSLMVETLVSDDGGLSWNMVRRETRAVPPEEAPPAKERGCNTTDWELEVPSGNEQSITFRHFDRQRNRWLSVTLPRHFQYERGRVVSSR
jgi:hypothetical protein